MANLRKYLYLHQHQNDSTVGFIKRFKASTYHHRDEEAYSFTANKTKEEVFQNFDSSDDDSSESESDSDSEVPMSQLKVGRAPKRSTQATKPPVKVIPPPVMIAVMMVVKVVVMIAVMIAVKVVVMIVLVTAPATAAPVTAAQVRKVPAMKVVRFIMHVNLIRQRVHLDVALFLSIIMSRRSSAYVQQLI